MRKYRISVGNPKAAGRSRGLIHVRNPAGCECTGGRKRGRTEAGLSLTEFRTVARVTNLSRADKGFRPILSEMSRKNGTFRPCLFNAHP